MGGGLMYTQYCLYALRIPYYHARDGHVYRGWVDNQYYLYVISPYA